MKKQKTNKVKTVVYLIHFILIDIWARNGVLYIFPPPSWLGKIIPVVLVGTTLEMAPTTTSSDTLLLAVINMSSTYTHTDTTPTTLPPFETDPW